MRAAPSVRVVAVLAAVGLGLGLGGCGGSASELFAVSRTGAIPGARLTLAVYDDGFVACNRGRRRRLSDALLLQAREIDRELHDAASRRVSLPPRRSSVLRYELRFGGGTVRFSDSSPRQTKAMLMAQAFTRGVARGTCGLAR